MEVRCPACAARYTADDEKLRGKTARMRCRACDTVWLVSGPPADGGAEERRAAVARRGAERERRDLFASRPPEHGSVRETLRPPPPGLGLTSGVAARNENSVLFKVEDVFASPATARLKTPEPSPASSSLPLPGRDDSGIIDLKALSSAPPKVSRPPVANLFGASEPPPAAFSREVSASASSYPQPMGASAPSSPRMRLFGGIAAAAAVVAVCGIGVAVAFGGENPPPKPAAAIPAPPPPAPPPVVAPAPAPEPATTSTAEEKKVASTPAKKGAKGSRASKGGAVSTSKSPAPPPPAKVKPADPCGCHGDFNCVLACTAGKK